MGKTDGSTEEGKYVTFYNGVTDDITDQEKIDFMLSHKNFGDGPHKGAEYWIWRDVAKMASAHEPTVGMTPSERQRLQEQTDSKENELVKLMSTIAQKIEGIQGQLTNMQERVDKIELSAVKELAPKNARRTMTLAQANKGKQEEDPAPEKTKGAQDEIIPPLI